MTNREIEKHEILKQAAVYSYDVNNNKIPNGYNLVGISTHENGFYACVLKKENNIIIAYRGTEKNSWSDIKNDLNMWKNIPAQAHQAIGIYDYVKREYPNAQIAITGHSLGGSLSQIVSAERGVEAVTFNAYGTRNLFSEKTHIKEDNIVNYCNPKDWVTTRNAKNHIGKCYEVNSMPNVSDSHKIESMQSLENRMPSSQEELQGAWFRIKKQQDEADYYKKTGKHMPIRMPSLYSDLPCVGSYTVSGYTRDDGTKVAEYTRTCGAKHSGGTWRNKPFNLDNMTEKEINEWLDEVI